ncbi:MAG: CCA tRNA nucleotidyltransferase [Pseudomonadota bacterium]
MKLQADWLAHPGTVAIFDAINGGGHGVWFVGGCVRNGLQDAPVDDIDITTDAHPTRVTELCYMAGLKVVPTGIDHGTVTVIAEGKPHEVTTLRRDVETDGRRATVAFSDRLDDDAHRRDFTMNALYATPDGAVLDPTGEGAADLTARRLRFIGHPEDRIREDYLRILRFFRFHAWYADTEGGLDADGLAACAALAEGLDHLSKERIGAEVKKLLSAPNPAPEVAAMAQAGILARILPGSDARNLPILVHMEGSTSSDPIRRLAVLGGDDVAPALRLSKAEEKRLTQLRGGMASTMSPAELGYRMGEGAARDILLLRAALFEAPPSEADKVAIAKGASAAFPVRAKDLMPTLQGAELGAKLAELETRWIASDFTLTREALLD